jgi:DNA-directed RNA polymerase sigma subunit (sigma70/sigma32)
LSSFKIQGLPVIEHIPKKKLTHAFEILAKIDKNIESSIRKNESIKMRKYLRAREIVTEYVVTHNFDLVFRVAEDYCYAGREYGHILCECNIGLIHSVDDYKPVNFLRFQTFAEYKIRESVLQYIFRHHPLGNFPLVSVKLLDEINRIDAEYFSVPAFIRLSHSQDQVHALRYAICLRTLKRTPLTFTARSSTFS